MIGPIMIIITIVSGTGAVIAGIALICLIGKRAQDGHYLSRPPCSPSRDTLTRGVVRFDISRKAKRESAWFERLRKMYNVTHEFGQLSTTPPPRPDEWEEVPHRVNEDGRNNVP